ncbi:hypothetical protein FOZ60_016004 [Perkinsus olseni]|uniref:Uncharacterized protein n=2 Tax=Perkinsus olseni TaxID=32597 RepID=A0A7J6P4Z3_PEROL|nr:hypothetical protein FOZ60_016004 [Perkinsus olseni]
MALPTTRLYSNNSRVTWVTYCSVFMFVCISQLSFASSDEPFRNVADYPKGCYAGPGPGEGGIIELMHPSCIFSQRGRKSDGVYQETGGILIRTNMAGHWGQMVIQVNLREDSTTGETEVSVLTSGWAHLWFEHDDIGFHWNPAPGDKLFGDKTETSVVPVAVTSAVYATYPDGKKASFPWYGIKGFASTKQMELLAMPEQNKGSDVPLYVWNVFRIEKVGGGWKFHITFTAAGDVAGKLFNFTRTIVDGVLHDRI